MTIDFPVADQIGGKNISDMVCPVCETHYVAYYVIRGELKYRRKKHG